MNIKDSNGCFSFFFLMRNNKKVLTDFLTLHMLDIIEKDMKTFRVGDYFNIT